MNTKLAFSPTAYKTSKLYSVLPNDGTGDFSFTRTTSATRVGKDGDIFYEDPNIPRLDYSGGGCPALLLEDESTNILEYSESFASWIGGSDHIIEDSSIINPMGGSSSKIFRLGLSDGAINLSTVKDASVKKYTGSIFVKKKDANYLAIRQQGSYPSRIDMSFNFNTGSLTGVAASPFVINETKVEDYGNGWFRLSWYFDTDNNTSISSYVSPRESSGAIDDPDTSSTASCYIFGAQTEEGKITSYIPTNGNQETRNADTGGDTGDISSVVNDDDFEIEFKFSSENDNLFKGITFSDSASTGGSNYVSFYLRDDKSVSTLRFKEGGSTVSSEIYNMPDVTVPRVYKLNRKPTYISLDVDGIEVGRITQSVNFTSPLRYLKLRENDNTTTKGVRVDYIKINN